MSALVFDLSLGEKTINKKWTFKDLQTSPFTNDYRNRNIKTAKDVDAIQNSINNIFLFRKGERIILPEFGNSLYEYLYEPINDTTAKNLGREILDMIEKWEPRISVQNVNITPDPDNNTFYVSITYFIPALNNKKLKFETAINQRRK